MHSKYSWEEGDFSWKNKSKTQNKFLLFLFTRKMNKNWKLRREKSPFFQLHVSRFQTHALYIIIQKHEFILMYSHNNYVDNMQFYGVPTLIAAKLH